MSLSFWETLPPDMPRPKLDSDAFWSNYQFTVPYPAIHLSILHNPYLELILSGQKTVESRFSLHRRVPYRRVSIGDVLLLKQTSGAIRGVAYVSQVWFHELDPIAVQRIRGEFEQQLQIQDEAFWKRCETLSYATLLELDHVCRIDPIKYSKKDRNAWAIFQRQD